jgi:hypothetical protein
MCSVGQLGGEALSRPYGTILALGLDTQDWRPGLLSGRPYGDWTLAFPEPTETYFLPVKRRTPPPMMATTPRIGGNGTVLVSFLEA